MKLLLFATDRSPPFSNIIIIGENGIERPAGSCVHLDFSGSLLDEFEPVVAKYRAKFAKMDALAAAAIEWAKADSTSGRKRQGSGSDSDGRRGGKRQRLA